jgi:DNA-binding NarL/FixJ family response regulator
MFGSHREYFAEAAMHAARFAEALEGGSGPVQGLLSSQELEIARLAADGLSNRETGRRMFLSPRTVSSHLYRMFPKLEVTSRAQLAAKIGAAAPI